MSGDSPVAILYDAKGTALSVTQSQAVSSSQPGIVVLASGSGGWKALRLSDTGDLFVTGSLTIVPSGITIVSSSNQPTVNQGNSGTQAQGWFTRITDGTQVLGTGSSAPLWVTGSVLATSPVLTQSVKLDQWSTGVTGALVLVGTGSVTGSVAVLNFPVTQSVKLDQWAPGVTGTVGLVGVKPNGTSSQASLDFNSFLNVTIGDIATHLDDKAISADKAVFGMGVVSPRITKIHGDFEQSLSANFVTSSVSGTGVVAQGNSTAFVSTGTGSFASASLFSSRSIQYSPGREVYVQFTSRFTTPTHTSSFQRAGLFTSSSGIFIGYSGSSFGLTVRSASIDTFVSQANFNVDTLSGAPTSHFARADVPEVLNPQLTNVWRIRFGWLGAAPIMLEAMSPDGEFVLAHKVRVPNTFTAPVLSQHNLPIGLEAQKTNADSTNLRVDTSSWDAGQVEDPAGLGIEEIRGNEYRSSNVTSQTADSTIYTVLPGRILMVTSLIIAINNASVPVAGKLYLRDGGVSGTVILPLDVTTASAGGSPANLFMNIIFPTPLRFNTSVYANIVAGTLTYSVTFVGFDTRAST